jgi:hypothetical protein
VNDIEYVIKLPRLHDAQQSILANARRFNIIKCGRRFGKTTLAKELIISPALDGYPVAYFAPTYKDLYDFWVDVKGMTYTITSQKDETIKKIKLITGGTIEMWSLDDPDSGRGRSYKRVVIDECEKVRHLEEAWKGTIRATLADYSGDCWFLSTPKFGKTYFKELFSNAQRDTDGQWFACKYTTYDNPFILKEEIDSARATLDDLYFRCEFLAEDVDLTGMAWAFAFDPARHIGQPELNPSEMLYLSFDFNRNPICCSVIQWYDECIRVIETIKLSNSDIYQLCTYIRSTYPNMLYLVTGDATGSNLSALVRDNLNYYIVIQKELNLSPNQILVPKANPRLEDNQVLINALLSRYCVTIHETKAKGLIYDMQSVRMLPDGSIDKRDRDKPEQQADALDTFRYFCNTFMQWFIERGTR